MSSVKEVARLANVSVATVSRVLNNDSSVKPETMQKVLKIIEEISYSPNLLAKNLRKRASKTIVLVLPSMGNPFYAGIARGAQAGVYETGYNIVIGTTEFQEAQLDAYIHMLNSRLADGIILFSTMIGKSQLKALSKNHPVVVLCNEYYEDMEINSVSVDNKKAAYDAAKELIQRGKRCIVYVTGVSESSSISRRISGYTDALQEAGIAFNPDLIVKAENDFGQVKEAINGINQQNCPVDGIITHSDMQAAYILKGIKENSIHLPPSVGLIGLDGTFLAEVTSPALTTISQPMYELGFTSVQTIVRQLQNPTSIIDNKVILPHQLVKRET